MLEVKQKVTAGSSLSESKGGDLFEREKFAYR